MRSRSHVQFGLNLAAFDFKLGFIGDRIINRYMPTLFKEYYYLKPGLKYLF